VLVKIKVIWHIIKDSRPQQMLIDIHPAEYRCKLYIYRRQFNKYEGILMLCESKIRGESNGITSHKPGNESVFWVLKTLYLHA